MEQNPTNNKYMKQKRDRLRRKVAKMKRRDSMKAWCDCIGTNAGNYPGFARGDCGKAGLGQKAFQLVQRDGVWQQWPKLPIMW